MDAHNLWEICDKPKSGIVFDLKRSSKYKYRLALRQAAETQDMEFDDEISNLYLAKDMNKFWKKWHDRFSKQKTKPHNINGKIDDQDIADVFSSNFAEVCFNSYNDNIKHISMWDSLYHKFISETQGEESQIIFHIE